MISRHDETATRIRLPEKGAANAPGATPTPAKAPKVNLASELFRSLPLSEGRVGERCHLSLQGLIGLRPQPLRSPRLARALRVTSPSPSPWTRRGDQKLFRFRVRP